MSFQDGRWDETSLAKGALSVYTTHVSVIIFSLLHVFIPVPRL